MWAAPVQAQEEPQPRFPENAAPRATTVGGEHHPGDRSRIARRDYTATSRS
jgi:hypothetical protein